MAGYPDIPTAKELGYPVVLVKFRGIAGPKGLPPAVIKTWEEAAQKILADPEYKKSYQDVTFPKYERYVADAADMAKVIRREKASDFPPEHDLAVQETLLKACGLPVKEEK